MDEEEKIIMDLILHAGGARSLAIEAIEKARMGMFEDAAGKLRESEKEISLAHTNQAEILERRLNESSTGIPMLMVHGMDQMMNAVTVLDMAREFADLYRRLQNPG
jgi:PTS system cellobiose-specific IIA component